MILQYFCVQNRENRYQIQISQNINESRIIEKSYKKMIRVIGIAIDLFSDSEKYAVDQVKIGSKWCDVLKKYTT